MTFERSNIGFFLAFMFTGAILGSALGSLITNIFPSLLIITKNLTGPVGFSLDVLTIQIRLSLSSIVGLVAGVLIYRKV